MTTDARLDALETAVAALCSNDAKHAANFQLLHEAVSVTAAGLIQAQQDRIYRLETVVRELLLELHRGDGESPTQRPN